MASDSVSAKLRTPVLRINTFEETFSPNFQNNACENLFSLFGDWSFKTTKFHVTGHISDPFHRLQNFTSRAAVAHPWLR